MLASMTTVCPHCGKSVNEWDERLVRCGDWYHLKINVGKNNAIFWIGKRVHRAPAWMREETAKQNHNGHGAPRWSCERVVIYSMWTI